jgi:hypothetical protein
MLALVLVLIVWAALAAVSLLVRGVLALLILPFLLSRRR